MSRPELNIIRSPSAEAFLRMVTQGFYNRSAMALWIYEVIGREWDELRVIVEGMQAETQPQTCSWSMGLWEWMYGIEADGGLPLEHRRQTLMRQICGVKPANPAMFRRGLAALLGTGEEDIEIRDFLRPYTFGVIFHPTGTTAFDYKRVRAYLDASKPAHLAYQLIFQTAAAQAWAYLAYGGRVEKRWAEVVPPPSVGPPETATTVIYGGVLAGMAGSAERTVAVPETVRPPECKPSSAEARFFHVSEIWKCWDRIIPPPNVGPPKTEVKAVYGGMLAGAAGSAQRTVKVPEKVGPPVCDPSCAVAGVGHTALKGRSWINANLHTGPPGIETTAKYGGALAGMAGALWTAGTGVELGI